MASLRIVIIEETSAGSDLFPFNKEKFFFYFNEKFFLNIGKQFRTIGMSNFKDFVMSYGTRMCFFVCPHHRYVRPLNKGMQLSSTLSYSQEQLPYPSKVFLLLRPWWTGSKPLVSLY